MTFLSPFFLWLLPLISAPTLIHLWNKYRVKEVEFSTISFLKRMESKSIKKVKLIELLLLILRTLIILLIVLFISRPVIRGDFSNWVYNPQSTLTAMIIDDSFSMNGIRNEIESEKLIYNKLEKINSTLLDKQFILYGTLSKGIEFYGTLEEYKNYAPKIEITDLNLNFDDIWNPLLDTLKHEIINKELYILTDLQKSTFQIEEDNKSKFLDWNTYILDFNKMNENLAINSLKINSEIILPNESFEIELSILNNGLSTQFQRLVVLNVDGLDVGQQLITIEPNEVKKVKFNTALPRTGNFKILAKLDNDDNLKDNEFYKTLNIPKQVHIATFSDHPNELLYLNQTLNTINNNQQIFTISDYKLSQLQFTQLNSLDVLFICGNLDKNQWDKVQNFVETGKQALIFPSSKDSNFEINSLLENASFTNLSDNNYILIHPDLINSNKNHSVKKLIQNKIVKPKFFKYYTFDNIQNSLINLEDNSSVWQRNNFGDGFVDILGFGLTTDWTNIPFLAGFIPFLHNWIYSGKTISSNPIYFAGDEFNYKQNKNSTNLKITDPQMENYLLNFDNFGNTKKYQFEEIGWYDFKIKNIIEEIISVNIPPTELEIDYLDENHLSKIFNNYKLISINDELSDEIKVAKIGTEIGSQLLLIIFFLLIIEMLIAHFKSNTGKNN